MNKEKSRMIHGNFQTGWMELPKVKNEPWFIFFRISYFPIHSKE